jgi:hypothetical protein
LDKIVFLDKQQGRLLPTLFFIYKRGYKRYLHDWISNPKKKETKNCKTFKGNYITTVATPASRRVWPCVRLMRIPP